MAHITGKDRSQLLLFPDAVGDYVGPDNPVRFIDAFVDSLDLEAAVFQRVRPNEMGRPGYAPADLLKLYIYGYLNRVRSSRRLEAETHRNLDQMNEADADDAGGGTNDPRLGLLTRSASFLRICGFLFYSTSTIPTVYGSLSVPRSVGDPSM